MERVNNKRYGFALIVTVGILAVLMLIGICLAVSMRLEENTAANYSNSIKARYLAEAGISKVIADIRNWVKTQSYPNLISNIENYPTGEQSLGSGSYEIISIEKETQNTSLNDGKININTLNRTDRDWISRLGPSGLGLTYEEIAKIIDYRDKDTTKTTSLLDFGGWQHPSGGAEPDTNKNAPYETAEEVRLAIGKTAYDKIKDAITVYSPIIRGGLLAEYYSDASFQGKIVELGKIGPEDLPDTDSLDEKNAAQFAGMYLVSRPSDIDPDNFGVKWYGYIYIEPSEVGSITFRLSADDWARLYIDDNVVVTGSNAWPPPSGSYNFTKPGWHKFRLEYYEDWGENWCELRWKGSDWDSAERVPAERLGFDPPAYSFSSTDNYYTAGIYKITATGRVKKSGSTIAEKKISTIVKIFGTWTQTQRSEFYQPWYSDYSDTTDGDIRNVNWLNSCPTSEGTTPNSLKLGFWDDFDEDWAYSAVNWLNADNYKIGNYYDADSDDEAMMTSQNMDGYHGLPMNLNSNYYHSDASTSLEKYAEAWEYDYEKPYDYPPCSSHQADHPSYDRVGWLLAKHGDPAPNEICALLKPYKDNGKLYELVHIDSDEWPRKDATASYIQGKTLSIDCRLDEGDLKYRAYLDGGLKIDDFVVNEVTYGKLHLRNRTCLIDPPPACDPGNQAHLTTYWDDIRVIHGAGYLISTPFYAGGNVDWGTISLNGLNESNITIETRSANDRTLLADGSWSSGVPSANDPWIQYKATLTTTINGPSTSTPVLKDITITYLPEVEILYWREMDD